MKHELIGLISDISSISSEEDLKRIEEYLNKHHNELYKILDSKGKEYVKKMIYEVIITERKKVLDIMIDKLTLESSN